MRARRYPDGVLDLRAQASGGRGEFDGGVAVGVLAVPVDDAVAAGAMQIVEIALAETRVLAVGEVESVVRGGGRVDFVSVRGDVSGRSLKLMLVASGLKTDIDGFENVKFKKDCADVHDACDLE